MLPDFPSLKKVALGKAQQRIKQLEMVQQPILRKIRTFKQHEGGAMDFEQVGYGRKVQETEKHQVEVLVRMDEIPDLVGPKLDTKLAELARQSGDAKVKSLISRVHEATELTGNKIDARGQPPSGSLLLDTVEAVEGSFHPNGESQHSWLVHPEMLPALRKAEQEIENDPELRARRDAIRERQRQQWIDRENSRKLVD